MPHKDGTETTPKADLELGMNFEQWDRDRRGFGSSVEMVTGGRGAMFGEFSGPEVGSNYNGGLGEERTEPTYSMENWRGGVPNPPGRMGKGSAPGRITQNAPQNYRLFPKGGN